MDKSKAFSDETIGGNFASVPLRVNFVGLEIIDFVTYGWTLKPVLRNLLRCHVVRKGFMKNIFFKGTISLIFSFRAQEMHCECFDKKWLSFDLLCKRKIGLFIVCRYLWLVFPSTQWYTHNHPPMSILSIIPMFTTWGFAMSLRISEDWNLFVLLHVFRRPPIHRLAFQQQGLWIDWKVIFVRYYTYSHHLSYWQLLNGMCTFW